MKIQIIKCLQDNYSYLIIDETNLNACVVDPSEAKPIIDFVESNNINLKYILNTHHHFDHVGGNIELKKKYNSNVIGFKGDKDRIPEIDTLVDDLKIWKEDNFEAKIFHIPGHTSGHIAFHFFKFSETMNFKIFKSFALMNNNVLHINSSSLSFKNLFCELGIFLIEK